MEEKRKGKAIVITSGKGGVGKTTTTANLGIGLALRGKKVVVVDVDIGLRNLDIALGLENRIVYTLVDVVEERCKLRQALVKDKRFENLALLPAPQTREKDCVTPEQMNELYEELKGEFDYVLMDSPAGIEHGFKNAVIGADDAVIVTTAEIAAVRDADRIVGILEAMEINYPKLVVNRLKHDMMKQNNMMGIEDVRGILAIELLGIVPDDNEVIVSSNRGEPVILNPKSSAGRAYKNIVQRLEGEDVPFMPLEESHSFIERIINMFGLAGRKNG
jgi:septum site-determining protein MinD